VADFLSDEWFERTNDTLHAAGPVPFKEGLAVFRIVLEFPDAPSSGPHAMTFTLSPGEASVAAGDHLAADAIIRLSFADALALAAGTFDSATALRQGRIKVRGDINAIVPLLTWLQGAHPHAAD
jgi:hypothetical protein